MFTWRLRGGPPAPSLIGTVGISGGTRAAVLIGVLEPLLPSGDIVPDLMVIESGVVVS